MNTTTNVAPLAVKTVTIADAITAGVKAAKAQLGVWNALILALAPSGYKHDAAVELAKQGEDDYKASHKSVEIPSTYRSAKSVALKALKLGVAVVTDKGIPLGKTEVEKAIKEAQGDKAPIEKVRTTLNTLAALIDKCDDEERKQAQSLLATLMAEKFPVKQAA